MARTANDTSDSGGERPRTDLSLPGSRAVVVGTGTHATGTALPDIPSAADTVEAVGRALRAHCGMNEQRVTCVTDPESSTQFLSAVRRAAEEAEDVLLLYFIGHGLLSLENDLYLATRETTGLDSMLPAEALAFTSIRNVLSRSQARNVVVVLDCCYSGRAFGTIGRVTANAFEQMNVDGSYLLSATSPNGQALAPEGLAYTTFSGALISLLRNGDPGAPRTLTLEDAYLYLERVLPARDAPAPRRRAGGNAGSLVLAVNPQAAPLTQPYADDPERNLVTPPRPRPCPYPGLGAFTAADARYFHGRERLIDEILGVLAARGRRGPLTVVGRSGAGKSSLLQAGLLPAVKNGRLDPAFPGIRNWPQVVMTPGEHPMEALARRLAADKVRVGLILCVDQFEEVFTACEDEAERRAFIHALAAASRRDAPRIQVIIGLRADFYDRCLDYPELASLVKTGQTPVQPMNREELTSAIEEPAQTAGLRLQEGLARRLLQDLESAEGRNADTALPLLAFALRETWKKSDQQVLTLSDYEATGGIWGAVTQQADEVYKALGPAQDAAKLMLLSMVQLGDGTDDVRRSVSMQDLLAGRSNEEQARLGQARDAYVAARLITVSDGTVELAHEALLRAWDRLRRWIAEDRQDLLDHQRLAEAARLWKTRNGPLYTGDRLKEARQWAARNGDSEARTLNGLERRFVEASARARRIRRARSGSFMTLALLVVLTLVAGGVYAVQQRASNQASQATQSSIALAQAADAVRATNPAESLWLGLAAYHSAPTAQARTALYTSYTTPYPLTLPGQGQGPVSNVAYSPNSQTAAASWADGTVRIWHVSDPLHPALITTLRLNSSAGPGLAYSPDGRLLAVHTRQSLELWNLGSGTTRPVLTSSVPIADTASTKASERFPIAFSPVGPIVATGSQEGRVQLWNVADPRHPATDSTLSDPGERVNTVSFSHDGKTLATGSTTTNGQNHGRIHLVNVQNPLKPVSAATLNASSALSVAFSPSGHLLVAAGAGENINAWTVQNIFRPTSFSTEPLDEPVTGSIDSIAFRPDGSSFATSDTGGEIEIWPTPTNESPDLSSNQALPAPEGPSSVSYSSNGDNIIAGNNNGLTELWTTLTPIIPGQIESNNSRIQAADGTNAFNPAGNILATVPSNIANNGHGAVNLWNISNPMRTLERLRSGT